ncbi:MAG: glucose-6-phosphate isomerase [Alphaproteobacteria bacterium]|nr:glucose-6-phosphate isomerase [Alphaproteobacteria bacterium]
MSWPPPLYLAHDHLPWTIDATAAHVAPEALAALPWDRAWRDLAATEAGEVVNVDEGRPVGHTWLRAPETAPTVGLAEAITAAVDATAAFAADVRAGRVTNDAGERFTDVVHLGIGGSALGPQLLLAALADDAAGAPRGLPVHFVDNTDPDGTATLLGRLGDRLRTSLVVIVSKSGSTAEPNRGLERVRDALQAAGVHAPGSLVAVTTDGSLLHRTAAAQGWLATLPLWDWVGGRFSLTSVVGLLPGALAGVDVASMLEGARDMDAWTRSRDPLTNPAAVLAGAWHVLGHGRGDRAMVVLPYADRLDKLGRYLQQLVMESLGKRLDRQGAVVHQGLTVYGNKGSTDQHAFVQQLRDGRDDTLVAFVQVLEPSPDDPVQHDGVRAGDHLQGFLLGTRRALAASDRPTITLTVPRVDAYTLGGLVALFERAVGLYASLVDLNAYHQPGVEAGKKAAGAVLALSAALSAHLAAGGAGDVATLAAALDADPVEVHYLLRRLAAVGSAKVRGPTTTGTWTA